jgi:hypothetical protein
MEQFEQMTACAGATPRARVKPSIDIGQRSVKYPPRIHARLAFCEFGDSTQSKSISRFFRWILLRELFARPAR